MMIGDWLRGWLGGWQAGWLLDWQALGPLGPESLSSCGGPWQRVATCGGVWQRIGCPIETFARIIGHLGSSDVRLCWSESWHAGRMLAGLGGHWDWDSWSLGFLEAWIPGVLESWSIRRDWKIWKMDE